jgi:S1-C subfamily serine protease
VIVGVLSGAVAGGVIVLLLDRDEDGSSAAIPSGNESVLARTAEAALASVVTVINEQPSFLNEQGLIVDPSSVGSGVIIDERGFILTNEHVIHNTGNLKVVLENGEERPAQLVSHDAPFTDLAVVRIPSGGLQALPVGDSDDLVLGQPVIAIGSALYEYRNSVSSGIVSGLHRRWLRQDVFMEDLIQTDTAINNGNSGGPLLNLKGEVVGVASTIVRQLGETNPVYGVAFAISSRTFQPIAQGMIRNGQYPRPYFGVEHVDISLQYAAERNLSIDHGALVQRVIGGGPAEKAGIRSGDVILRIGRNNVNPEMPFINALALVGVNERVPVQVWRDNRALEMTIEMMPR